MPQAPQRILITGGAGFIGSHTCLVLLEAGRHLVVLDNFSNSCRESLRRVVELVGGDAAHNAALLEGILTGKDRGPRREIVVMNAAAAFQVAGLEGTWEGGRARAEETIDSGRAAGVLAALRAFA